MTIAPTEVKRGQSHFDPHQPRDREGKWVETGAELRNILTRRSGRVIGILKGDSLHEGGFRVQMADGSTAMWERSAVEVVRNADGSKPTAAPPGTPGAPSEHAKTPSPEALRGAVNAVHQGAGSEHPAEGSGLAEAISAVYPPSIATATDAEANPKTLGEAVDAVHSATAPHQHATLTAEDSAVLTNAQQIAIKQKWKLPTGTLAELQAKRDAVTIVQTPTVAQLVDQGMDPEKAIKEAKRLAKNAQVNAWRQRAKYQAAIDTLIQKDKDTDPGGGITATAQAELSDSTPENDLVLLDKALSPVGNKPTVLYDVTFNDVQTGKAGPGSVRKGRWTETLAKLGDNSAPIPVAGVTIHGHKVETGWAQRINGRSYLVEAKDGETPETAAARMHTAAAMLDTVLKHSPGLGGLQTGLALVNVNNPQDEHWAKTYGIDGFISEATGGDGTTVIWGGKDPNPGTLVHEFGHTLDYKSTGAPSISGAPSVIIPGQKLTWSEATAADAKSNAFYANGKFKETRPGHPIVLGTNAVTGYGANSPAEDFAESVRLYVKDRRETKIGYDPTTGDNIRFVDLFPERAKILDALFGVQSNYDTAARKRRQKEAYAIYLDMAKSGLLDHLGDDAVSWNFGPTNGLDSDALIEQAKAAISSANEDQAKAAAAQVAKAAQEQAKKAAEAAKAATSFEDAYSKGLITKDERTKLTARRRARAYHARQKGLSKEEALAQAMAWEQAYLAERFGAVNAGEAIDPWAGKETSPTFDEASRAAGQDWLLQAGKTVHPLAKEQATSYNKTNAQAKANIAAELASRFNTPDGWAVFQAYAEGVKPGFDKTHAAPPKVGAFDEYTDEERIKILSKEMSNRVHTWAVSSGDTAAPAVVMQIAARDEFKLDAHPAPRIDEATYKKWETDYYTQATAMFYRMFLRQMYLHTQEQFAAAGITHVSLYRGMNFAGAKPSWAVIDGKPRRPQLQPVNSWSTNRSTSESFAGGGGAGSVMFKADIPVELIVGSALTGLGCLGEFEFVVMDAPGSVLAEEV